MSIARNKFVVEGTRNILRGHDIGVDTVTTIKNGLQADGAIDALSTGIGAAQIVESMVNMATKLNPIVGGGLSTTSLGANLLKINAKLKKDQLPSDADWMAVASDVAAMGTTLALIATASTGGAAAPLLALTTLASISGVPAVAKAIADKSKAWLFRPGFLLQA